MFPPSCFPTPQRWTNSIACVLAGFAPPCHTYRCIGYQFDPDPEALVGVPFSIDVMDSTYNEFWVDEVRVFPNPLALKPIPLETFPDAGYFLYEDGKPTALDRGGRVLSSMTMAFQAVSQERFKAGC
jgi:hypothetical protein